MIVYPVNFRFLCLIGIILYGLVFIFPLLIWLVRRNSDFHVMIQFQDLTMIGLCLEVLFADCAIYSCIWILDVPIFISYVS